MLVSLVIAALAGGLALLFGQGASSLVFALGGFAVWIVGAAAFYAVRAPAQIHDETLSELKGAVQQRDQALAAPVGDAHRDELRRLADNYRQQLNGNNRLTANDHDARAFAAHFPEVDAQIGEWNAILDRVDAINAALLERFKSELTDRGLVEPALNAPQAASTFYTWTQDRVIRGVAHLQISLEISRFEDLVYLGTGPWIINAEAARAEGVSVDEYLARLEDLFWDGQRWPEADAILHRNDEWPQAWKPLDEALHTIVRRHKISGRCYLCD